MGELDCSFGPTRRTGELDGAFGPTRPFGELDGASGPIRPFVECDKIRAEPCEGCLRTLVEGIKPFVVHPGVEILKTCFSVRPLRSMRKLAGFSEDARIFAKRQILGSRIRVFDTMPRDVRDQCAGFRTRP
ncbi:hypothetical protein F2Q68_00044262 [Brassica cretica]|uniref:Uncharacterized protein n=1 Tax=Brassica cretica TaxID=69181 RepID=A0A8S9LUL8_BRACR|nr:hypothetical protein F2Q68_00044262 [Brassica cretica]